MNDPQKRIRELESRINILEEENSLLSAKAEENLLLSKAYENINSLEQTEIFLQDALESISLILMVEFAGIYELVHGQWTRVFDYASFSSEEEEKVVLNLSQEACKKLTEGRGVFVPTSDFPFSLQCPGCEFTAQESVIIKMILKKNQSFVFIFANGRSTGELEEKIPLLERLVQILSSRYQKIYYQEELEKLNQSLEQTVQKKTQELEKTYQHLFAAQKLEALGVLAGGIAHDFNNLLGGLYGFIDMALRSTEDSKAQDYLTRARKSMNRATALTHQLLTFAKGSSPLISDQNLIPFVQETVEFALSGSNLKAQYDFADDLAMGRFDRNQIAQVIDNLVINAKQAMTNGGLLKIKGINMLILADEVPGLEAGSYVKISIQDQGPGVPKEILGKIFDPFFTTKSLGQGLGLAHSFSILKKHKGTLEVESPPEGGSIFHFYIPRTLSGTVPEKEIRAPEHQGKGKILIMDDEEGIRELLCKMLEFYGYEVIACKNGEELLFQFKKTIHRKDQIKAMIFDLTIPGSKGGLETLQEIQKEDPKIPVIAASGYGESPVMENPQAYGFSGSLRKPFVLDDLSKVLETLK